MVNLKYKSITQMT